MANDRVSRWVHLGCLPSTGYALTTASGTGRCRCASRLGKRFNGRLVTILRTMHFDAGLGSMFWHYHRLCNHRIPQWALGHLAPVQDLENW